MAPLTDTKPKPLVEVAGRPLLDHALDHCDGLKKVVNAHYFADQIQTHISGKDIQLSDERGALLDTGGGLKKALPLLGDGPVFTMNTDAAWRGPNPIETLLAAWKPEMEGLMLLAPRARAVGSKGPNFLDIGPDGRVSLGADNAYLGAQIIRTDRLASIEADQFSMWDLWTPMLKAKTLFGTIYDGMWCDVGSPESIPVAQDLINGLLDV